MPDSVHGNNREHAVQVVRVLRDNTLQLDEAALRRVLYQDSVKELPVAVISVAGKFRQGKSFLLGFFLRYLHAQGASTWLDDEDAVIQGFDWRGGQDRVTTGIFIWSEPFIVQTPSHGKVAVVLMDSQGTDDTSSGVTVEVPIFALTTLLSSVLVFNVIKLARSDLENLRLFIDYGTLASEEEKSSRKPFQTLQFLLRDWNSPKRHPFGATGGEAYITNLLQKLREGDVKLSLEAAFNSVKCFLMPHPGTTVDSDDFEGRVEDVEKKFTVQIREFAALLLTPESLVPKKDFGDFTLTGAGWCGLFSNYFKFFQSGKCPKPKNLFEVSRVDCYEDALVQARRVLDEKTLGFKDRIELNHDQDLKPIIELAWEMYNTLPKLGNNKKIDAKYSQLLQKAIEEKVKSLDATIKQNKVIDDLRKKKQELEKKIQSDRERKKLENEEKEAEKKRKELEDEKRRQEREQEKAAQARRDKAAAGALAGVVSTAAGVGMAGVAVVGSTLATGAVATAAVVAAPVVISGFLLSAGGHLIYRWAKS